MSCYSFFALFKKQCRVKTIALTGSGHYRCFWRHAHSNQLFCGRLERTRVSTDRSGFLYFVSDLTLSWRSSRVKVEEGGSVKFEDCQVLNCVQYGIISHGQVDALRLSVNKNKKTGILSRGQGAKVSGEEVKTNENDGNGMGCDEGGMIEVKSSEMNSNKQVGLCIGALGSAIVRGSCMVSNSMHGASMSAGYLVMHDCDVR
jgi:hypothetical protein